MIQQWQALFAELDTTNEGQEILSTEELQEFEMQNRIILPTEYREYCQVFGTGLFGHGIRIYCPTPALLEYSKASLESIKEELKMFPSDNRERDNRLKALMGSGFVFADDFGANIALWDLRSYSERDDNYDIYLVDIDGSDEELYQVGRSFFEFVCGYCLGRAPYSFLPEDKRPEVDTPQIFTSFAGYRDSRF
jgi:hypothetical protein